MAFAVEGTANREDFPNRNGRQQPPRRYFDCIQEVLS